MGPKRSTFFALGGITFSLLISGCDTELPTGHFAGNLFQRQFAESTGDSGKITRTPVRMEILNDPSSKGRTKIIQVTDADNTLVTTAEVSILDQNHLRIHLPIIQDEPFELAKTDQAPSDVTCFENKFASTLELCFDQARFFLQILDQKKQQTFALSGNLFTPLTPPPLEKPIAITLDDAMNRGLNSNFDSRISFEHVLQANHAVKAAYLNLIPHLTSNTIWNASFGYISFIATLSSVAPFLLPSYWIQAEKSKLEAKVAYDLLMIMRADLMTSLEGLLYSFDRDSQIVALYERTVKTLEDLEKKIETISPSPTAKSSIRAAIADFSADRNALQGILKQSQYAISQSLGYFNPEAILSVSLGEELEPYPLASQLDNHKIAELATERSFELQQLNFLIEMAHNSHVSLFFNWLDPTGDPSTPLGFNLIEQVEISRSQIRELEIKKDQLISLSYNRSFQAVDEFNQALERVVQLNPQGTLPHTDLSPLFTESFWNQISQPSDFKKTLMDLLTPEVTFRNQVAAYRTARAKIDRLLLRGYFAKLQPHAVGSSAGPILLQNER